MADTPIGFGLLRAALALVAIAYPAEAGPSRLSGIVIAGEERVALFAGAAGETVLVVREGDALGDERVVGIDARTVWLDGPAGRRSVSPGEDAAARAASATIVPPPPLIDPYRRELETENDQ